MEYQIEELLAELFNSGINAVACDEDEMETPCDMQDVDNIRTFNEAGLLTSDSGIVLRMKDGSEYQLTIVQSR